MIKARYNFEGFKVVIHSTGLEVFLTKGWYKNEPVYNEEVDYEQWDEIENTMDDGEDLVFGYRENDE